MFATFRDALLSILFPNTARERVVTLLHNEQLHLIPQPTQVHTAANVHVTALLHYSQKHIRELIHSLKFHNSRDASVVLARMLGDYLTEYLADAKMFNNTRVCIVPVPLSRERKRARGFNQIERVLYQLAKQYPELRDSVATNAIARVRNTTPQTKLGKSARLDNLRDAFAITDSRAIKGAHVIIVDDITTTGATLAEVARSVKTAQPARVTLLALASA